MSVSFLNVSTEVEALIEDLGLIPLSSSEAQDSIRAFLLKLPVGDPFFEERNSYFSCLPVDLLDRYYKYNSKGKRRVFGCCFEKQLSLF